MTISSSRILKIYKSLDKEQIQLVIDKKIEGKLDIQQWLEKLKKLAVMDTLGDDSRKRSGEMSMIFGLFTAFTTILMISKPFLFFFPLGFFVLFLYFLVMFLTLSKIDIGNNLRNFIVPILEHYEENNMVDGRVYLKMDFSNPKNPKNSVGKTGNQNMQHRIFKHHWMEGEMKFDDQVVVRWKIVDIVTESASSLQEKAKNIDVFSKNHVNHQLEVDFLIPKDGFEVEGKDVEIQDLGKYYQFLMKRTDESESLEEGMIPDRFIETITEGYRHVTRKELKT